MTETHIKLDISRPIGRVAAVVAGILIEPFALLIERLRAEGRVTEAELAELRQAYSDRLAQLDELLPARLREVHESAPLEDDPDSQ